MSSFFVANPLSVSVQPWGKKRLILDLRHVNKPIFKQSVKYKDWKTAMSYFVKDAYMFSFDLKSGYHRIDIAQEHQTFLGFSWRVPDSINKIFCFYGAPARSFLCPLCFHKGFEAFKKVLENTGTLYRHLLG